jgi:hypothetical protein
LLSNAIQNWSTLTNQELDRLKSAYDVLSAEDKKQWDRAIQEAGITGTWNGQDTLEKQALDFDKAVAEAGLTGYWEGKPTYSREMAEKNLSVAVSKAQQVANDNGYDIETAEIRREIVKTAHDMAIDKLQEIYGNQVGSLLGEGGSSTSEMDSAYENWYNYFLGQLGASDQVSMNEEAAGYIENYDPSADSVVRKEKTVAEELVDSLYNISRYK